MSSFQEKNDKTCWVTLKYDPYTWEKAKQSIEIVPEKAQMLNLVDKTLAILGMFKELK